MRAETAGSWARRNASTRLMACIVALYEWELWGKWPSLKMADIPLRNTGKAGKDGWVELLKGEAGEETCVRLYEMANAEERPDETWKVAAPGDRFTFWDGRRFVQNPFLRVSDVAPQFVHDMSTEYGLAFTLTAKDDADAQRNNLRDAIGKDKFVFLPGAGPVIPHLKNAMWNENRTDYQRSKVFGHYDCMAATIYWWRNVLRDMSAEPPQYVGKDPAEHHVAGWVREKPKTGAAKAIERAFSGGNRFRQKRVGGWR